MSENRPEQSPLGKAKVEYQAEYDASLLFPIPRSVKRNEIEIQENDLPFTGHDVWNAYELSWLNGKGKPFAGLLRCSIPAETPNIIESKSFKLYLNSLNQTRFESSAEVSEILRHDLSQAAGGEVTIEITSASQVQGFEATSIPGLLIDDLDVEITTYSPDPTLLEFDSSENTLPDNVVEEELVSHLLKSNCLVTGQPDWGSVYIKYSGKKIDREALLKFIVSFRGHDEFHEQCVERIFKAIWDHMQPSKLLVQAFYTRRGGLDINPARTKGYTPLSGIRTARQ